MLLAEPARAAFALALASAGRSKPARMAIIAITTSNSIRVKPLPRCLRERERVSYLFVVEN